MRIRGHIDYGSGAGPKAPERGFVKSAERKAIVREAPRHRYPHMNPDEVLAWLRGVAKRGERMPTKDEIDNSRGSRVNKTIRDLARAGKIIIYVAGQNWRHIEIDGLTTAKLPGNPHPYRRISKDGDHWWRGDHWEAMG